MSSTVAHSWWSDCDNDDRWITVDSQTAPTPTSESEWHDFVDEHLNRPGDVVVVALARRKLKPFNEDGRNIIEGFSGEDDSPDISALTGAAVIEDLEDY